MNDKEEWISLKEAGKIVGRDPRTVLRWIKEGTFPLLRDRRSGLRNYQVEKSSLKHTCQEPSNQGL
jgi:predicted site-specific integrase-resolvase